MESRFVVSLGRKEQAPFKTFLPFSMRRTSIPNHDWCKRTYSQSQKNKLTKWVQFKHMNGIANKKCMFNRFDDQQTQCPCRYAIGADRRIMLMLKHE